MPEVELLSRLQFAITVGFHYIYPPLSIGLGVAIVIMEGMFIKTKNPTYEKMSKFWVKIFALTFAMGVATGIVMEFEFGTNWATYSRFVGDVFGSALAAEGVFAFFLESGFLAILVFGWNKVGPKMHFLSAILVAFGAHLSAVWIVVANSWQQTPAGFHIVGEGFLKRAEITDFWQLVFNPSSMDRLSHVLLGAWLAGSFFIMSVSAYYIIKNKHLDVAKASIKIGIIIAVFASLMQLVTGHNSADGVSKNQPAKLAAFEGHFDTGPADMYILGWVNADAEKTSGIKIPGMLSWLISYNTSTPVKGLKDFAKKDRPPVNVVFQAYHIMIGIGTLLIIISLLAAFFWWRKSIFDKKWFLKILLVAVLLPQIANQIGWVVAEVGRQPWIVYNLLRTSDALSKSVTANQVTFSLIFFTLIYLLIFVLFLFLLDRKIKHGPDDIAASDAVYTEKDSLFTKKN